MLAFNRYDYHRCIWHLQLRMTVWSLTDKSVSYIKYPKDCLHGVDFTQNGKYMALAERRDCKDCISIFTCNTWQLLKVGFTTICYQMPTLIAQIY